MNIETTKAAATQLLNGYYNIHTSDLPTQRAKSEWQDDNKRGFFLGIIQEGETSHTTQLHDLLAANQFAEQQQFSTKVQLADSEHPPHPAATLQLLQGHHQEPALAEAAAMSKESELSHRDLKNAVEERDRVCLFCWDKLSLQGAHIIAQKNIGVAYNESPILLRAGLAQKHQVQNGLLLCIKCHDQFDKLERYVDVVDNKLVVKVVNHSVLLNDDKHMNWIEAIESLKDTRFETRRTSEFSDRQAVESNGEMALYFVLGDPTLQPNRDALEFHKTACLIWRIAGGAESDDEYCPYDDDDGCTPVDYRSKSIEKWMDSSATLIIENVQ
ncbi:hypothetical protein O5D80_004085 [Batrachochytrium dendrobatidis]|nr:hypothetical protein O5D80_004085 [Batrachochytrium dendrobatidis]